MDDAQRRLAKQFFFFALQGIRRQYAKVETVFLAHAAEAWEFKESQFFQASSSGGTVTSSVARLTLDTMATRYDPSRYNTYFFYASDGENAAEDRDSRACSATSRAGRAPASSGRGIATFRHARRSSRSVRRAEGRRRAGRHQPPRQPGRRLDCDPCLLHRGGDPW
jgi:hypothetical protein